MVVREFSVFGCAVAMRRGFCVTSIVSCQPFLKNPLAALPETIEMELASSFLISNTKTCF
jgi:hypothetical protein